MMTDTAVLYDLQKIDYNQAKVRQRILQIQKLLGETEKIKAARQQVAETQAKLQQWQSEQTDKELESQGLAARIKGAEDRLMSGKVSNPKELESLQSSVEALRRQREGVEDSSVEAMLMAEDLENTLSQFTAELQQLEVNWRQGQEELQAEEKKLKRQFVLLKQKREQSVKAIKKPLLAQYEQLRKRKGGIAVAPLQQDSCGACHMQVPTGVISNAKSTDSALVYCPSCGRILFGN